MDAKIIRRGSDGGGSQAFASRPLKGGIPDDQKVAGLRHCGVFVLVGLSGFVGAGIGH